MTNPYSLNGLSEGAHALNVRARDSAGNADLSPANANWTIDTHAPRVAIQFPGLNAYTDAASIQIRGSAMDSGAIASVTINGVAAASSDGFLHWTATVPVATGNNSYVLAAKDAAGNTNPNAATVKIANRGAVLSLIASMALDSAHNRLLISDGPRNELLALHLDTGIVEPFSGRTRGVGALASVPLGLTIDAAHNRVLGYDGSEQELWAFDLDSGDRTTLTSQPSTSDYNAYGEMDYDATHDVAYVPNGFPRRVVAIDVASDTRRVITSDMIGTGPAMAQPKAVLVDPSSGGTQLFLADVGANPGADQSRIFKVDVATGNRTVLSTSATPAVGTGPAIYDVGNMTVDAAHNRLLIAAASQTETARLLAVDLTTGNRTLVAVADPVVAIAQFVYDAGTGTGYLGLSDRARVLKLDPATQQFVRFSDSLVGSGPAAPFISSTELDPQAGTPSLVAATQLSTIGGSGGAVRIDPTTGDRALITGAGAGTGPGISMAKDPQFDTRAGAPASQFLVYDPGVDPSQILSVDSITGNRTLLSTPGLHFSSSQVMTLDAPNNRLLAAVRSSFNDDYSLTGIDVNTGTQTVISGPTRGTGPPFAPVYGVITAIRADSAPGRATRYLVSSLFDGVIMAVDPATGDRTQVYPGGIAAGVTDFRLSAPDKLLAMVVVGGVPNVMEQLDLDTGVVTTVSGEDFTNLTSRGSGPVLIGSSMTFSLDGSNGIVYAVTNEDSITAIDLSNGQRAIVSR